MTPSVDVEWELSTCDVPINSKDLPSKHALACNQPGNMTHQNVWRGLWIDADRSRYAPILDEQPRMCAVDSGVKPERYNGIRSLHHTVWRRIGIQENRVSPQEYRRGHQEYWQQFHDDEMPIRASTMSENIH